MSSFYLWPQLNKRNAGGNREKGYAPLTLSYIIHDY